MSTTFPAVRLIKDRSEVVPANMPADAFILHAPRPLFGDNFWQADGLFYVAIGPDEFDRARTIKKNQEYGATFILFFTEAEARGLVRAGIDANPVLAGKVTVEQFERSWRTSFDHRYARCTIEVD